MKPKSLTPFVNTLLMSSVAGSMWWDYLDEGQGWVLITKLAYVGLTKQSLDLLELNQLWQQRELFENLNKFWEGKEMIRGMHYRIHVCL